MSSLSREEIDAKIAETLSEISVLSQQTNKKADDDTFTYDDEIDENSVSADDFMQNYGKYEIEFINDEYQPDKKKSKPSTSIKAKRKSTTSTVTTSTAAKAATSTKTSTTATVTASTAARAAGGRTRILKKDIELPVKIDLIELVKEQKCIYNLKDPLYKSRVHKQKVWEKISEKLMPNYADMNVDKCKKMWESVRESAR